MSESASFKIDPSWYYSSQRAEQEWDHVWTKLWHMGPRLEELPEPGDAMVHTFGRESLIFVRDASGELRGLYNVCRHRASKLLLSGDGPAHMGSLTCPFHGWRYSLDGALEHVPYRERFDPQVLNDKKCSSLKTFRVETFAGWVWFTLNPEAPDLMTYLGPIAPKLDAYSMEKAHIVDYKTIQFECNWKTTFDAFNESYHFQCLHSAVLSWGNEDAPITLLNIHSMMVNEYGRPSKLYPEHGALNASLKQLLEANGIDPETFKGSADDVRRAVMEAKREKQAEGSVFPYDQLSDSQLTDAYHFLLFPSIHFNLFPEFYVTLRYRPHPSGNPEKMYFDFIMCAPLQPGEEPPSYQHRVVQGGSAPVGEILDWGVRNHPVVNQVLGEDVELVEHVQAGLRSDTCEPPILSTDERRITHFHQNIDNLIRGVSIEQLIRQNTTEPDAHTGN